MNYRNFFYQVELLVRQNSSLIYCKLNKESEIKKKKRNYAS